MPNSLWAYSKVSGFFNFSLISFSFLSYFWLLIFPKFEKFTAIFVTWDCRRICSSRLLSGEISELFCNFVNHFINGAALWAFLKYSIDLRALTQGRGEFEYEFIRYEEVPENISKRVKEERNKDKDK